MASLFLLFLFLSFGNLASAAVFTLQNNCKYTVWAGTLSGNTPPFAGDGSPTLGPTQSLQIQRPPGWSGRFWGRTGCTFDASGSGKCSTGDCGGGLVCTAGGEPPVTLAEFTLAADAASKDFYDVSLVDGYNVGMSITSSVGNSTGGDCQPAGCVADLNASCPPELRVSSGGAVIACRSACAAFNTPEYCCTGEHATPETCPPTNYSGIFKSACPTAYSYAYDDATSTRTCSGSDYLITFCPA